MEPFTQDQLERMFDDMLDDSQDEVKIGVYTFRPSYVLKECDHIAYDEAVSIFLDGLEKDGELFYHEGEWYYEDPTEEDEDEDEV